MQFGDERMGGGVVHLVPFAVVKVTTYDLYTVWECIMLFFEHCRYGGELPFIGSTVLFSFF